MEVEERAHADLVRKAEEIGLDAWRRVKVTPPVQMGTQTEDVAGAR